MALSEFALIDRYFRNSGYKRPDVRLGIGDDAALLDSPAGLRPRRGDRHARGRRSLPARLAAAPRSATARSP